LSISSRKGREWQVARAFGSRSICTAAGGRGVAFVSQLAAEAERQQLHRGWRRSAESAFCTLPGGRGVELANMAFNER
jgi:hypothetical protein